MSPMGAGNAPARPQTCEPLHVHAFLRAYLSLPCAPRQCHGQRALAPSPSPGCDSVMSVRFPAGRLPLAPTGCELPEFIYISDCWSGTTPSHMSARHQGASPVICVSVCCPALPERCSIFLLLRTSSLHLVDTSSVRLSSRLRVSLVT